METAKVVIRQFNPNTDSAMVYSTWRNSAYYGVPRRTNDAKLFFKNMTRAIREILKTAQVRVACLDDDPLFIVGYAVFTGIHLDWVYVKADYRKKGVGTLLVPKNVETVTSYETKIGKFIIEKKKLKTKENDNVPRDRQEEDGKDRTENPIL